MQASIIRIFFQLLLFAWCN